MANSIFNDDALILLTITELVSVSLSLLRKGTMISHLTLISLFEIIMSPFILLIFLRLLLSTLKLLRHLIFLIQQDENLHQNANKYHNLIQLLLNNF